MPFLLSAAWFPQMLLEFLSMLVSTSCTNKRAQTMEVYRNKFLRRQRQHILQTSPVLIRRKDLLIMPFAFESSITVYR